MPIERRRAYYSGRVQGVGFRFISQRLADGFGVSGSVRNLPDGRVELIAQGESDVISAFLEAVGRELGDKIHSTHVEAEPMRDPPERGFTIRD
jgi:acylphosphatase